MSDIIRLLPDSVANQIAAGEVIQRPASAIKELVENAIDAGATEISIVVKDAGKTIIQVIDNGTGMSETDARMAFERHATSKIRSAEDLFSLHTMGFRGEALPSICAISEVDIKTKTNESNLGTHLIISGSKVELQEPCVCDKGTVITIKKLFFNVPARRKFLKSDNVELSNIVREFERMALVNNNVKFHFDSGAKVIDLRAGSFKQRILDLWKSGLDSQLIPISVETSLVKIEGFISRPEFARRRNTLQFLIANGRCMRNMYFHKAILGCYENLIANDTQPCYFIKFEVDPNTIDVNRSPTKDEIEFEYKQQIWPILTASIKAALGKFSAVPSIDFLADAIPIHPLRNGELPIQPKLDVPSGYNPFKTESGCKYHKDSTFTRDWDTLYNSFTSTKPKTTENNIQPTIANLGSETDIRTDDNLIEIEKKDEVAPLCIQYALKYIIMPSREGLLIIDQYRAHVRILYEEYMSLISRSEVVSQHIMFPERITLNESQKTALLEVEGDLHRMGFLLEYDSDDSWFIASVPSMFRNADTTDIIFKILDSVNDNSLDYGKDENIDKSLMGRSALLLARSTAIRRGTKLSVAEMENLTCKLFETEASALTPDGNRIYSVINEDNLIKLLNK